MINQKAMNDLFKPFELDFMELEDLLNAIGLTFKENLKISLEDECSKSIDGSCINSNCIYNYVELHGIELYSEVMQEIQAERKAVEDKLKRDMEKYCGD